jgi:hypothetical protein
MLLIEWTDAKWTDSYIMDLPETRPHRAYAQWSRRKQRGDEELGQQPGSALSLRQARTPAGPRRWEKEGAQQALVKLDGKVLAVNLMHPTVKTSELADLALNLHAKVMAAISPVAFHAPPRGREQVVHQDITWLGLALLCEGREWENNKRWRAGGLLEWTFPSLSALQTFFNEPAQFFDEAPVFALKDGAADEAVVTVVRATEALPIRCVQCHGQVCIIIMCCLCVCCVVKLGCCATG